MKTHALSVQPILLAMAAVLGLVLLTVSPALAVPVTSPPRVLILDETVVGGATSQEALAAQLAIPGCAVDIVTAANWALIPATGFSGPTGFGFDKYRALIIGDPICNTSSSGYLAALSVLNGTKTTWTPMVTGNVIIEGVDNAFHAGSLVGADKTLKRGIAFAVNDPTKTGLYYAMSCYYDYTAPAVTPTLVPHLTGFGTFMTRNYNYVCFDDAHIVATHPVFTATPALTDSELSGWSCSTHEGFDVWPANFIVLAIALTNGTYTATDGSNGIPYILVRGEGVKVISTIDLNPPLATNNVGTTHTVCATLATNVFPKAGVPVTFTIVSGPNAVTNFTTLTDTNGTACFTYAGYGGPGVDIITASYTDSHDNVISSGPVTKIWVGACVGIGCENLECLADGSWSYKFCVTNLGSAPVTSFSLATPSGITFTPSFFNLIPILNPGQSTNLSVIINSSNGPGKFCFLIDSHAESPGTPPCAIPQCITLPTCCNRVITNSLTYVSTVGNVTTYNYSITLQNITGTPLKYVGFAADQSCVTFLPPLINLTLPAFGGPSMLLPSQTRTLNLQVQKTAPCPGTNTFWLSTFTSNLIACCSTKMVLPPARCVYLSSPYDGSVVLTNTAVRMIAIPKGPCPFSIIKFYWDTALVGIADLAPYETTYTPTVPGTYTLTAVATLATGEVETSDPVQITVLAPAASPDQHEGGGFSLTAGVTGTTVLLNVPTEAGHLYTLQYTTNLLSGQWQFLQTIPGDGSIKTVTDSVTNEGSRFYRAVSDH